MSFKFLVLTTLLIFCSCGFNVLYESNDPVELAVSLEPVESNASQGDIAGVIFYSGDCLTPIYSITNDPSDYFSIDQNGNIKITENNPSFGIYTIEVELRCNNQTNIKDITIEIKDKTQLRETWTPKWNNLAGYWRFDETSWDATTDEILDSSGNNNHGVSSNSPLLSSGYNRLDTFGAAQFNGNSGSIQLGERLDLVVNNFSVSFWAKTAQSHQIDSQSTAGVSGTSGQFFVMESWNGGSPAGSQAGAGISLGINGISVYEHAAGYMPAVLVVSQAIGIEWNHYVLVYNNRIPSIYINGLHVATGNLSPKASVLISPIRVHNTFPKFGSGYYGDFSGQLDEVAIWNTALDDAEILKIYNRQSL